ncbi:AMP-binding protein [Streptomyces rimosus]|uniref:AMP-binding protein n=1 Tax=Streptomyces rimosus TaxID=1927 RepID=UPI0004CAF255|nr:AMP-binding protein [Streptomyces rimosus]
MLYIAEGAPPPTLAAYRPYFAAVRELGRAVVHGYEYGVTECPTITVGTSYDSDEQFSRTIGRTVTGVRVRIVRLDGSVSGPGETGEVTVRGTSSSRIIPAQP